MTAAAEKRSVTIAEWYALAQQGVVLPMRVPLDGDSMRPLIRRGQDMVSIVPLKRPLKRSDVVLFEFPAGRYVVHRVYRLRDGQVRTLGDNCLIPEPWLPKTSVLGLVAQFERNGRVISLDSRLARAFGRVWMAGLPLRRAYWRCRAFGGRTLRKLGLRR